MELEFHQLDQRYEALRLSSPTRDRRVLASLARDGQQLPVVVVGGGDEGRYILVDGYKRVRALRKLREDTVRATCWDLPEQEALLLGQLMRSSDSVSALEQGWILRELRERFDLSIEELARRFDRSMSWVSGRLGLVNELPEAIQQHVRQGQLVPHAAMKFLLPLARKHRQGAVDLAAAIAPLRPSSRQTEALCVAYARGNDEARQCLISHPEQILRARETSKEALKAGAAECLFFDLEQLSAIARRGCHRVQTGAIAELVPPEIDELQRRVSAGRRDAERFFNCINKEVSNARRATADNHSDPV